MIGWPRPITSQFEKVTGFSFNSNYLEEEMPERYAYYIKYLEKEGVRRSIHVGDQGFGTNRNKVYELMSNDFAQSVKPMVEELLNENYKILFYASQLDVVVPHTGIDRFIRSLSWKHSQAFLEEPRKVWRVNSEIAGYTKEANNLVHLLIRNAGHVAPFDQPERCFDMITRFTRGHPF
jgi:vitellogenic carboxypeptidase-like protein